MNQDEKKAMDALLNFCEEILAAMPIRDRYKGHPESLYDALDEARDLIWEVTH